MAAKYYLRIVFFVLLVSALVAFMTSITLAAEFKAKWQVMEGNKIGETGNIYVKAQSIRMEETKAPAQQTYMIIDSQSEITYLLYPAQKSFIMLPQNLSGFMPRKELIENATKKHVGLEKVKTYDCEKYQYFLPGKKEPIVTQWVAKLIDFPMKACYHEENKCWEMSDIQKTAVDDTIFQVPKDYKHMTVKSLDKGEPPKRATQKSSATREETALLIDMAKLAYKKGYTANAAAQLKYALMAVWRELPFTVSKVRLVKEDKSSVPRENNIYAAGERIYIACYVLGYQFKDDRAQITADYHFLDTKGKELLSQKKFGNFKWEAGLPDPETQLNFNFRFTGVPAGNYLLKVILHDEFSGSSVEFSEKIVFK